MAVRFVINPCCSGVDVMVQIVERVWLMAAARILTWVLLRLSGRVLSALSVLRFYADIEAPSEKRGTPESYADILGGD